jgi:precorrin-8X/cobalt-precorrin-8 methylmutase
VGFDYLRDPQAIYAESFRQVRAATDLSNIEPAAHALALRLVHACGEPALVADLRIAPGAVAAAKAALRSGAPVYADCEMAASGITRARLAAGNEVRCTLNDARAVELWQTEGAIVTIGNAPTALFHMLERIEAGAPPPACILGFCVGFVGAAEAKAALAASNLPFITLAGRRGGSALAAAAVNALASESEA